MDHQHHQLLCINQEKEEEILPRDTIYYNILTRVPLDSLISRCRYVCKDWNHLLHQPHFQHLYSHINPPTSGFFIQSQKTCKYYTTFLSAPNSPTSSSLNDFFIPDHMRIESSSSSSGTGGLLCCVSYKFRILRYYVCKPMKREWRQIPNPNTGYLTENITIIPTQFKPSLHYKIVRISNRHDFRLNVYNCEIFDSKEWVWKRSKKDIEVLPDVYLSLQPGLFVNGSLHWLTNNHEQIFIYNVEDESWKLIEVPIVDPRSFGVRVHEIEKKLVEYGNGRIGMIYNSDELMEIWVLMEEDEEDHNYSWKMERTMNLLKSAVHCDDICHRITVLDYLNKDDGVVVLRNYLNDVIWYDLKKNTCSIERSAEVMMKNIPSHGKITFHAFQTDLNSSLL